MIKKMLPLIIISTGLCAKVPLYLSLIKNTSQESIYKVYVPAEDYSMLIFPQSEERLERWMNLADQKKFYISTLKGDGETIFVEYGPEPSGACDGDMMPQSIIYWRGSQSTLPENKTYQAYCPTSDTPSLALTLDDEGTPEITPLKNVTFIGGV